MTYSELLHQVNFEEIAPYIGKYGSKETIALYKTHYDMLRLFEPREGEDDETGHPAPTQRDLPVVSHNDGSVRITQDDLCTHVDELVDKEQTTLKHLQIGRASCRERV